MDQAQDMTDYGKLAVDVVVLLRVGYHVLGLSGCSWKEGGYTEDAYTYARVV